MSEEAIVYVVDDDPSARTSTRRLLRSVGLQAEAFPSAQAFLDHRRPDTPSCVILDVRMPGISGLDLQQTLAEARIEIPIIFITAYGTIPMTVQAMKEGAVDFLPKPVDEQALLDAVNKALELDRRHRAERSERDDVRRRMATLSEREREVLMLVAAGRLNKQVALALGITERTVKFHRANVMKKMGAESLADLVRLAEQADTS